MSPSDPSPPGNAPITGLLLSGSEQVELKRLQEIFDPQKGIDKVDAFGKWLFATSAIVGVLGAAFSNKAFQELEGNGRVLFAVAIVMTAASLASAAQIVAPKWETINRSDIQSMRDALKGQFRQRRRYSRMAALFFALALLLAGAAPLFSGKPRTPRLSLAYSLAGTGILTVNVSAERLQSGGVLEAYVENVPGSSAAARPRARGTAGATGSANASLTLLQAHQLGLDSVVVLCTLIDSSNSANHALNTARFAVPVR